ncbi:MAG: GntR family transcriptional regulator, partial [Mesorhizobium sp.]
LPSENELVSTLGVSRMTVYQRLIAGASGGLKTIVRMERG